MMQRVRHPLVFWTAMGALAAAACTAEDDLAPPEQSGHPVTSRDEVGIAAIASLSSWGLGEFGSGIGASGIVSAHNGAALEVYLGGSTNVFGDNDIWYALRYSPATGGFQQVYVSDQMPLSNKVRRIGLFRSTLSRTDIAVALEEGTVRLYNQRTKQLSTTRQDPCFLRFGLVNLTIADLDGNGIDEFISTCSDRTVFAHGPSYARWSVPGAGGGPFIGDVAVGQMDGDPALEIATTGGFVIDSATHAVEWQLQGGFGEQLQAIDIDDDGRDELIAAGRWSSVRAYDVDARLQKWSIQLSLDIGTFLVADIDEDGSEEVFVGDGQGGTVYAFDATTAVEKWSIDTFESGVSRIAVLDVDGDGDQELMWGAGDNSTGPDFLNVADWQTRTIVWRSEHVDGPFVGPEVGDLDGDGVDEMVVASFDSDVSVFGDRGGRIVVIDGRQLTVRGISPPVASGNGSTGVHDLALRDVNGDGRREILVATDWRGDGVIEAYSFSPSNEFTLVWTNQVRADLSEVTSVEAADIDGDGEVEVLGGDRGDFSGNGGIFVRVYDSSTGAEKAPFRLGGSFSVAREIIVGDTDGDGAVEVAVLELGGDVHIFDGASRRLKAAIEAEGWSLTSVPAENGLDLVLGDANGRMSIRRFDGSGYAEVGGASLSDVPLDGLTVLPDGRLLVGAGEVLHAFDRPLGGSAIFTTQPYGWRLGHRAAVLRGSDLVFTAGGYGIHGFRVPRVP